MALIVFKYGIHGNPEGQQVMLILVKWKKKTGWIWGWLKTNNQWIGLRENLNRKP